MIAFSLLICGQVQQQSLSTPSVHNVKIEGLVIDEALKRVAQTYQTVIGFEQSEPISFDQRIKVSLSHATLAEALDAIVKSDGRYSWRQESTGAIHVFIAGRNFSFPEVVLVSLDVKNLNRQAVSNLLNTRAEVVAWRQEHKCSRGGAIVVTGAEPADSTEVTLQTSEKTLRDNLDEIVSELGTYYWIIDQTVTDNGCFASVALPPPDSPRRAHYSLVRPDGYSTVREKRAKMPTPTLLS